MEIILAITASPRGSSGGKLHPQLGIGRFALRNPNLVAYDERQELVGNVVNVNSDEWHAHWELVTAEPPVKDKDTPLAAMPEREAKHQVHNKYTRVRPCFLHIPGLDAPPADLTDDSTCTSGAAACRHVLRLHAGHMMPHWCTCAESTVFISLFNRALLYLILEACRYQYRFL